MHVIIKNIFTRSQRQFLLATWSIGHSDYSYGNIDQLLTANLLSLAYTYTMVVVTSFLIFSQ